MAQRPCVLVLCALLVDIGLVGGSEADFGTREGTAIQLEDESVLDKQIIEEQKETIYQLRAEIADLRIPWYIHNQLKILFYHAEFSFSTRLSSASNCRWWS